MNSFVSERIRLTPQDSKESQNMKRQEDLSRPTPPKKIATIATWPRIARGLLLDLIGWLIPWIAISLAFTFIPPLNESDDWKVLLVLVAAAWSIINIAIDTHSLRTNGWTKGFRRIGLFVVDPAKDHIKHLARLRKSIRRLLRGDYDIYDRGRPTRKA